MERGTKLTLKRVGQITANNKRILTIAGEPKMVTQSVFGVETTKEVSELYFMSVGADFAAEEGTTMEFEPASMKIGVYTDEDTGEQRKWLHFA